MLRNAEIQERKNTKRNKSILKSIALLINMQIKALSTNG